MTACPACTSNSPYLWRTCSAPFNTMVNSSNSGVCPGSTQPCGLRKWATLTPVVAEFTRPMYSSMSLGLLPAACMRVGCEISVGGMSAPCREVATTLHACALRRQALAEPRSRCLDSCGSGLRARPPIYNHSPEVFAHARCRPLHSTLVIFNFADHISSCFRHDRTDRIQQQFSNDDQPDVTHAHGSPGIYRPCRDPAQRTHGEGQPRRLGAVELHNRRHPGHVGRSQRSPHWRHHRTRQAGYALRPSADAA